MDLLDLWMNWGVITLELLIQGTLTALNPIRNQSISLPLCTNPHNGTQSISHLLLCGFPMDKSHPVPGTQLQCPSGAGNAAGQGMLWDRARCGITHLSNARHSAGGARGLRDTRWVHSMDLQESWECVEARQSCACSCCVYV